MSRRDERRTTVVRVVVQHDAEGVNVDAGAIRLALVDFGRHIGICTFLRQSARGFFNGFCNTEVAELEFTVLGNENVLRLNVTVNDVVFAAQLQCAAYVNAESDHICTANAVFLGILRKRGEQLHANKHVPADLVRMLDDPMILIADDVAFALELRHDAKLLDKLLHEAPEVRRDAFGAHAVVSNALYLRSALRNGDRLERRLVGVAEVPALDLEHLAEAALADLSDDAPLPEYRFIFFVIARIH